MLTFIIKYSIRKRKIFCMCELRNVQNSPIFILVMINVKQHVHMCTVKSDRLPPLLIASTILSVHRPSLNAP